MAITKVYLLSVPLEKDYAHTLWFSSALAQSNYFQGRVQKRYDDFTYQRKDNIIRVPDQIDTLYKLGVNYVMYQNPEYNDKWFYAFITNMQYINDGRTDITIQTDCLQTWMFEKVLKPCFVEREHAAVDTVGAHTIDEGLELGEYICNLHSFSDYGGDSPYIVLGATKDHNGENVQGTLYNNTYSGVRYYAFNNSLEGIIKLDEFLANYDADGIGEAITCMFMAPASMINLAEDGISVRSHQSPTDYYINSASTTATTVSKTLTKGNIDGYTPRNNKLLSYPFRYLLVGNNSGASAVYKYERFENGGSIIPPCFVIEGVINPGCSIRMVPLYYNGIYRNDEEGINMGKFPVLNWASDVYTNWLTQNGVNIALEIVSGVGQIVAGTAVAVGSGGLGAAVGGGSIVGGVSQIAGTLAQIHAQSFAPPQAKGNLNSGDVVTATRRNDFHFYDMTVKAEFARIIDEYFDMYGYKTHRVKIPEQHHRENYWFTKTIDANITGAIPQDDLQTIKDCYNRGVTYWRIPANFKDYTVANGTV